MHPSRLRLGPSQSRPLTDASPGSARPPGLRVCRAAPSRRRNIHTHAPFRTERQSFLHCRDMRLTISRKQLDILKARQNMLAVGRLINAKLKTATLLTPDKPHTLEEICRAAAPSKGVNLSDPIYAERMSYELKLIADKQFEDYFYIIHDIMKFAREKMICGPARGSSSGSLVCHLLDITTVNPIPFGLIFERFIDEPR